MTVADVATERTWPNIPAEYPADPCDCFWHNRRFLFVSPGDHDVDYARWHEDAVPLARSLTRVDYTDGTVVFQLDAALDGIPLRVARTVTLRIGGDWHLDTHAGPVALRGPSELRTIDYRAWLAGNPLDRANPTAQPILGRVDPILIFNLPRRTGYLVVWAEAWWWRPDLEPLAVPDQGAQRA